MDDNRAKNLSMVVTDLDGTLLGPDGRISPADRQTLQMLGERNIVRVIATGRSLYSVRCAIDPLFPIDYVIFSSGAGVMEWPSQDLLHVHHLSSEQTGLVAGYLIESSLDFMLHLPIPENHRFFYHNTGSAPFDFMARLRRYREFATPLNVSDRDYGQSCQFVAITGNDTGPYHAIREYFEHLRVIRTTSPLDGDSIWIEIFPRSVSKSLAAQWLCDRLQIPAHEVLGIGNDYNDIDLLEWASSAVVVSNAPAELRSCFEVTGSNMENGFTQAVYVRIS